MAGDSIGPAANQNRREGPHNPGQNRGSTEKTSGKRSGKSARGRGAGAGAGEVRPGQQRPAATEPRGQGRQQPQPGDRGKKAEGSVSASSRGAHR
jgi:hypothetical protein